MLNKTFLILFLVSPFLFFTKSSLSQEEDSETRLGIETESNWVQEEGDSQEVGEGQKTDEKQIPISEEMDDDEIPTKKEVDEPSPSTISEVPDVEPLEKAEEEAEDSEAEIGVGFDEAVAGQEEVEEGEDIDEATSISEVPDVEPLEKAEEEAEDSEAEIGVGFDEAVAGQEEVEEDEDIDEATSISEVPDVEPPEKVEEEGAGGSEAEIGVGFDEAVAGQEEVEEGEDIDEATSISEVPDVEPPEKVEEEGAGGSEAEIGVGFDEAVAGQEEVEEGEDIDEATSISEVPDVEPLEKAEERAESLEEEVVGTEDPDKKNEEIVGIKPTLEPSSLVKRRKIYKIRHPNAKKGLVRINKEGVYEYKVPTSSQSKWASVRFGAFSPDNLENRKTGTHITDIYGDNPTFIMFFDYEWKSSYIGPLNMKAGSGLFIAQGHGTFVDPNSTLTPKESFSLVGFPFSFSLVYRAQYWKNQFFIPHVDGGMDLFTFAELRDDHKGPKFGGSLAGHIAAGGSISLGFLDRSSSFTLDSEYGINSMWFTGEIRSIFRVAGSFDFSDHFVNFGLAIAF